ncbi:MAG: hypothetical protein HYV04_06760 [Deltaproteobacteria bacterium]|nr:hypothetical protein [Deltaproteobacteria bacterium]
MKKLLWIFLLVAVMAPSAVFAQGWYGGHGRGNYGYYYDGGYRNHGYGYGYSRLRHYRYWRPYWFYHRDYRWRHDRPYGYGYSRERYRDWR